MKRYLSLLTVILLTALVASAQTEADLKRHFEGRHVAPRIDMPATEDGVNVYPERAQPFDYSEYAARLKRHGASIRRGETVTVTNVKVKGRHVEFHLGGGARFNVQFALLDSGNMTPGAITDALRRFVDFSGKSDEDGGGPSMRGTSYEFGPRVVSVGPRTTFLKEGLSEQEVLRLLGRPSLSTRATDGQADTVHEFPRGEGRFILAEFRGGVLVRARTVGRANDDVSSRALGAPGVGCP